MIDEIKNVKGEGILYLTSVGMNSNWPTAASADRPFTQEAVGNKIFLISFTTFHD